MSTQSLPSATAPKSEGLAYNQNGQKLGSKGYRTRKMLIETTVELLETRGLRQISVADVARAADTSPGTFYVYFRDVSDVVLAALENISHTSAEMEAIIAEDWLVPGAAARALDLVVAFTDQWNMHRTIFSVRNLAGEEGDIRFSQARTNAAQPMIRALVSQIRRAQQAERVPAELSAYACAATIVMTLERLAAVGPTQPTKEGLNYAELRRSAAFVTATMLGAGN